MTTEASVVSLKQFPSEVPMGRKTVFLDEGRGPKQIGYWYGPDKPMAFTRHFDREIAQTIAAEVCRLENVQHNPDQKLAIPAECPKEFLPPAEDNGEETTDNFLD